MKKLSQFFYRFSLIAAFFLCGLIFFLSLVVMNHGKDLFLGTYGKIGQIFVNICSAFVFIVFLVKVYQLYNKIRCKRTWIVPLISFVVIVLFQVLYTCFVSCPAATTDAAKVMNEALAMLGEQQGQLNMEQDYFQHYHNNHFIVLFFYYFYMFLQSIGITSVWIPTILLNVLYIDLGIFISYLLVKKVVNRKVADYFLFLCVLCPTTYVWLTFAYTNTLSIPFVMGSLYLYLVIRERSLDKKTIGLCVLFGCCIFVGCMIRLTTIIPVIAIVLCHILHMCRENDSYCLHGCKRWVNSNHDSKCMEKYNRLIMVGVTVSVIVLAFVTYNQIQKQHISDAYEENKFPATHWIMMGTQGYGQYNEKDVTYTNCFPTQSEKKAATIKMIKKRVSSLGIVGTVKLVGKKVALVWALGADDALDKGKSTYQYPVLYDSFLGNQNGWFIVYLQVFRVVTFFFLCISIWHQIQMKEKQSLFLCTLTLLGTILFFILWEANCKYNICFLYLCLLFMSDGVQHCLKDLQSFSEKCSYKKSLVISSIILALIADVVAWNVGTAKGKSAEVSYRYFVEGNNATSINKIENNPEKIEQTIQVGQSRQKNSWNRIQLFFKSNSQKNTKGKEYRIEVISNPSQNVLYTKKIGIKDLEKDDSFCICMSEKQGLGDVESYTIRMTHIGETFSFVPKIINLAKLDTYPYGELRVMQKVVPYDLYFHLYEQ